MTKNNIDADCRNNNNIRQCITKIEYFTHKLKTGQEQNKKDPKS